MTDKATHKPGCEALGGYGQGIGPCSCSEAQPEALYVAEQLDATRHAFGDDNAQSKRRASAELRRQQAEIQQLKAEKAEMARLHFENYEFQRTKADNATATVYQFHYAMKDAGWHPGRTDDDLTEIIRAKGRELAQLSARQAAPDETLRDALVRARDWFESQAKVVSKGCGSPWNLMQLRDERDAADAALSAAPPPPEREPKCWCETCRPNTLSDMRFIVCPDCGNKRCPKATHHDNACTNSNAPGQPGSSWEHVKPHGATND